ncbi:ellis-van Creveld syndrome protein-like isoform X2 [Carcharodon carcharias]|uniref:ellis-van Creveld syndrome protein-like isoform X2 n=1 Tax=Carcharodon carcharias TaxID=13397 RepID=UPI001B7EDD45|nr:ellis-van Creveld syndrome protein-like isoform X2 [Carcharodon carcharias]
MDWPSCSIRAVLSIASSELQVYPGLLAVAVVLGFLLGMVGGILLYTFVLESALQRKEICSNGSDDDSDSEASEDSQSYRSNQEIVEERGAKGRASPFHEENETSLNSNIAAFALKARVIYPINQKFRPLADGSSHPSLLEGMKQRDQTKRAKEDIGSELHDQKDERDCHSFPQNYSPTDPITRAESNIVPSVTFFSEVLVYTSPDVELGLYRLSLQALRLLDTELRQEKYMMFLQLLRIQLNDLYLKEKIEEKFYRDFLSIQEKELEKLEKTEQPMLPGVANRKASEHHYTLEETERDECNYLQYTICQFSGFLQQTESTRFFLLTHSTLPKVTVQEIMRNISEKMLQVESLLTDCLTFQVTVILDKLLHWEFMAKSLHSLKWILQQENKDKLKMVTSVLNILASNGELAFWQKEEILARLQSFVQDSVDTYINECAKQTKELILEMKRRHRTLVKQLEETQRQETINLKERARQMLDPTEFIQNLHSASSWALDKVIKQLFTETLPNLTGVSFSALETLRSRLQQDLTARKQATEEGRQQHLKQLQGKLAQMKQVWLDEQVLNSVRQKHLVDKQEKIIQAFLLRQSGLDEKVSKHIMLEHKVALQSMVRQLTLRQLSLMILKEMKLFTTKCLLDELGEQRLKESPIWDQHEDENMKLQDNLMSKFSEEQEKLCQEAEILIHQQLAAESQAFMDFLGHHMEQVIGHVLTQQARVHSLKQNHDDNTEKLKNLLVQRATESVYVTMEGVTHLIQNYYQQLEEIMEVYKKDKKNQLRLLQETFKRQKLSEEKALEDNLNTDLVNVKTILLLPRRIQYQLVLQQKRTRSMLLLEEETHMEFLKQRAVLLNQLKEQVDKRLKKAEQTFMSQLAALARVSHADWKTLEEKFLSGAISGTRKRKELRNTLFAHQAESDAI